MPYPWLPPRGKPDKKAVFSPHCGDETTTYYNRALWKRTGQRQKNSFGMVRSALPESRKLPTIGVPCGAKAGLC